KAFRYSETETYALRQGRRLRKRAPRSLQSALESICPPKNGTSRDRARRRRPEGRYRSSSDAEPLRSLLRRVSRFRPSSRLLSSCRSIRAVSYLGCKLGGKIFYRSIRPDFCETSIRERLSGMRKSRSNCRRRTPRVCGCG